jgi:hypothetical protein
VSAIVTKPELEPLDEPDELLPLPEPDPLEEPEPEPDPELDPPDDPPDDPPTDPFTATTRPAIGAVSVAWPTAASAWL